MATHIVSWGGNEHVISPVPSSTPSIVSVDPVLSHERETSSVQEATGPATESLAKQWSFLSAEPRETSTSASTYQTADTADDSFTRHNKYFFKDGNVTFLVDGTLYRVHQYFFSRDSVCFAALFDQLGIRDHEALPIISLSNIERKDLDAFLSILYPENFEQHDLSSEEWRSVLHISTRWHFASIRRLALINIKPPTSCDRLLLARTYSVDDWVIPALSALCERRAPLSLDEARQMDIEDVVLVATVREDIRTHKLQVDAAEIPHRVKAALAGKLVHVDSDSISPAVPTSGAVKPASSSVDQKRAPKDQDTENSGSQVPQKQGAPQDIDKQTGEPPQPMDDCQAEEMARKTNIENVRRQVEEAMHNVNERRMTKCKAGVQERVVKEERAAELKAKAEDAKCKAEAARVVLEAASGLEKAAANDVARAANKRAKCRADSTSIEATEAARRATSIRQIGPSRPNKRPADEENDSPRKTRGVTRDYKQLDNPFSDTDEDEDSMILDQVVGLTYSMST